MRLHFLVYICITMFEILCLGGTAFSEPPAPAVKKADPDGPFAQLEALGVFFGCFSVHDNGMNHHTLSDRDKNDPSKVEHIKIGKIDNRLDEIPRLPEKVFDILPLFPNLRSVRFEYFWFEPDELRRLKEIPKLRSFAVHISRRESRKSFKEADDLDFLKELPDLESLRLTSSSLTNEMIEGLLPLKSLKRLNLRWNYELTHAILPTLEKLPALESLIMRHTGFAAPKMEARRFAARLKSFSYSSPDASQTPFSLEELREIVTLPRHIWGYLHKTNVPLADIVALLPGPISSVSSRSYCNEIKLGGVDSSDRHFSMCISRSLSDEDLATIGKMVELRNLSIQTSSAFAKNFKLCFTDDGLGKLACIATIIFPHDDDYFSPGRGWFGWSSRVVGVGGDN